MNVVAESALRILLRRRNVHDPVRYATRKLIHQSIAQIRACTCDQAAATRH